MNPSAQLVWPRLHRRSDSQGHWAAPHSIPDPFVLATHILACHSQPRHPPCRKSRWVWWRDPLLHKPVGSQVTHPGFWSQTHPIRREQKWHMGESVRWSWKRWGSYNFTFAELLFWKLWEHLILPSLNSSLASLLYQCNGFNAGLSSLSEQKQKLVVWLLLRLSWNYFWLFFFFFLDFYFIWKITFQLCWITPAQQVLSHRFEKQRDDYHV